MFRRMLFSAFAALALAGGILMTSAVPGSAAPLTVSPAPQIQVDNNLIQVRSCGPWNNWCNGGGGGNCGPWNNWCGRGGGGGGGGKSCVNFGGVQFCVDNGGSNCRWHNGVKYCRGGGGGGGGGSCIRVNGERYCSYKHNGDCIRVNGNRYCRF